MIEGAKKKRFYFKLFLTLIVLAAVFLPGYTKYQELRNENERLKKASERLTEENRKLITEKKLLSEDPVYIEKKIRENLGLVKKGEIVYKLDTKQAQHE